MTKQEQKQALFESINAKRFFEKEVEDLNKAWDKHLCWESTHYQINGHQNELKDMQEMIEKCKERIIKFRPSDQETLQAWRSEYYERYGK